MADRLRRPWVGRLFLYSVVIGCSGLSVAFLAGLAGIVLGNDHLVIVAAGGCVVTLCGGFGTLWMMVITALTDGP